MNSYSILLIKSSFNSHNHAEAQPVCSLKLNVYKAKGFVKAHLDIEQALSAVS